MHVKKIGILGGGQLGRMLLEAAHRLDLDVSILDVEDAPAKKLTSKKTLPGRFDCAQDILQFVQTENIDILTVEIEHIDTKALLNLPKSISIIPSIDTLRLIQDKYLQKCHLKAKGIPVAEFGEVNSVSDILKAAKTFGYPLMLKSKRMAYDGKGNFKMATEASVMETPFQKGDMYVENWVPFVKELAVMVIRTESQCFAYPVVETYHQHHICHSVLAPSLLDTLTCEKATQIALKTVATFTGAGIFGVEMFYLANGEILVNEIAPRPHNSGHYTIEACETSQFENHLRAICQFPLGSTRMKVPYAAMYNVLGHPEGMEETWTVGRDAMKIAGASVHWYGKHVCKPGRKMGHVTVVAKSLLELQQRCPFLSLPPFSASFPLVAVIMGSDSDLSIMQLAVHLLRQAQVPYEMTIVSAHRTPDRMYQYAKHAHQRGLKVIIAGAGGAAHLPGMVAALTPLPVIGVPIALKYLDGQDSLLSIVQMPRGVPVATVAINNAVNAGLLAIRFLGSHDPTYQEWLIRYQSDQASVVLEKAAAMESQGI